MINLMGLYMTEDKAGLILIALGMAIVDLIGAGATINKENLLHQLERNRRDTGNVVGKGANRDAAELVRKGQ